MLLSALISGLTNVVAFTVDELGHHYTGIPGIENEKVNMHDVGHNKTIAGVEALVQQVGHERVLFGSYAPLFILESAVWKLRESPLGGRQLEAIQSGNARQLIGAA